MIAGLDQLAIEGRLYTSVILHGGSQEERLAPRSGWRGPALHRRPRAPPSAPAGTAAASRSRARAPRRAFHPDVHFLWQDLRTVTSADATRQMLRTAQLHPFEARGQVFVIVNAETLSDEAANVLLKMLEEPPRSAPRNFLLLDARGRPPAADRAQPVARRSIWARSSAPTGPREDGGARPFAARSSLRRRPLGHSPARRRRRAPSGRRVGRSPRRRPFALAASAVMEAYRSASRAGVKAPAEALLALAEDLLLAPETRTRNISAQRILEGLVSKHLTVS